MVSAGNSLYLVSGGDARLLLRIKPGNWFWHAVVTPRGVYVQEYGESPTGIYFSEDLRSFSRVAANLEIDPLSRHFHHVAYDAWRDLLVVTLGDGNIVRVAVSGDGGRSWRSLYKGPWQFVPVLVEEGRWILGFDSGIARGGVGVYKHGSQLETIFLAPPRGFSNAQFSDLKRIASIYVGGLGQPTAIIASRDLRSWHLLYVGRGGGYNYYVAIEALGERILASTGEELLVFSLSDLEKTFNREPFLRPYRALADRARGLLFMAKRLPWLLRL